MAGGAAGSLGGPATAALGAGVGLGAGELAKDSFGEDDPTALIAESVAGLDATEIRSLIAATVGEQQGFFDGVIAEIYGLAKLVGLVALFAFLAHVGWTFHRRKKGEGFYAELQELKGKFTEDIK